MYKQLIERQRYAIYLGLKRKWSKRKIASELGIHTVNSLLKRCHYGFSYGIGTCSWIACPHINGGRSNAGILLYRQCQKRNDANRHNNNADDHGQQRTLNECHYCHIYGKYSFYYKKIKSFCCKGISFVVL